MNTTTTKQTTEALRALGSASIRMAETLENPDVTEEEINTATGAFFMAMMKMDSVN
jgi:hypothetical protein